MINLQQNIRQDLKLSIKIYRNSFRKKSFVNDEYQYWQRSIVPTLHFQRSLPRLPIPTLEKTCERYLRALKPLLDDYTYSKTKRIVQSFQINEGVGLQKELQEEDKKNKHTSYISKPWFEMYLSDRTPLPINYNPCLVYINKGDQFYDRQLIKISNLIISSLRFYKSLKENVLEPEVFHLNPKKSDTKLFRKVTGLLPAAVSWYGAYLFKAYPLDMIQYTNLFNSTRIPEIGKDRIYQDKNQRHIVVMKKGNVYTFDVINENGDIVSPEVILSSINFILNDNTDQSEHPIGVLTTCERNKWAEIRQHLEKIGNKETLNKIDTSLFVVSLDNVIVKSLKDISKWFLHSDGVNRWFDKSFTLISTINGFAGINFEHSWGDGVAVLRYFQDIFKDFVAKPRVNENTQIITLDPHNTPQKLNFIIDDKIKTDVRNTMISYQKTCNSLDIYDVITNDIGKDFCKKHNVSPDALMQLSFQLAYYNQTRSTTATYESCSTAAFKNGRTETVRPCTVETKEFCEGVNSSNFNNEELKNKIINCSAVHTQLVKNAAMGQGFDRHLFALRKLAEKNSKDLPQLFKHKSYEIINHNILSTSTLSSDLVLCGGFGPVVSNGYGIAYMIRKDSCGMIITNYKNQTDGNKFSTNLQKSLEIIKGVLQNT